ncbi:MAG: 3-hydroxybutyryl-CoA dehydrogenase [Syntrophorhabdales bacterium]
MEIEKVGIVGCGTMGAGIAQLALEAGYRVTVRETDEALLAKGVGRVRKGIERLCEKGALGAADRDRMVAGLTGTTAFADLADCDLIVEAVFEDMRAKTAVFREVGAVCKNTAILASNTSSLSITEMAVATKREGNFLGLHFFNPVGSMPLVEIVRTMATRREVVDTATGFVRSLKKQAILAKDAAGFIVNRLLTPYLLDAIRTAGEGVASIEDIDMGMKLGCNHPMGPLMLADFIGLDVLSSAADILFDEYKDKRYAAPPALKRMVLLGFLGLKSGKGFYDWSDRGNPKPVELTSGGA